MRKVNLVCIGCPLGCSLEVAMKDGKVESVSGNNCPNGDRYARREMTCPMRSVTSVVRVTGGTLRVVSVKTAGEVPKGKIFDCVRALKEIDVSAPVRIGDVILKNVAGTGVDVVATKNVLCKRPHDSGRRVNSDGF